MAQSEAQLQKIARDFARKAYRSAIATSNHTELKDAMGKIDLAMNATGNQIAAKYPTIALKSAIFQEMKTVAPNITASHAATALAIWALEEAGIL
jgi:hypothetical protein